MRFLEGITLDVRHFTHRSLTKHLRVRPCNGASLLFIKILRLKLIKKLMSVFKGSSFRTYDFDIFIEHT